MKKRILIVDDEVAFCEMVKVNLELTDQYEVFTETRGKLVLETAKRVKPDLILLDVILPDISGPAIMKHLRANQDLNKIPIMFLTAMSEAQTTLDPADRGKFPFIQKPVGSEDLVHRIESYLSERNP